jgi:hypothetical protein
MSRSRLSNFSFGPVQDPHPQLFFLKINHEARVTDRSWRSGMRLAGENTLPFPIGQGMESFVVRIVNSKLNNTFHDSEGTVS